MKKNQFCNWLLAAIPAVVLVACGGGGGSGGTGPDGRNTSATQISLRAEKSQLPMNVSGLRPGTPWNYSGAGNTAAYTTSLTVEAKVDGRFIPSSGTDEVFSCALDGAGIEVGSLYYLDGKSEHEVDFKLPDDTTIKVPGAYRAVALPSYGGIATFHFHADGTSVGDATVQCSYTDPRDRQVRTASTTIRVGPREINRLPSVAYITSTSVGSVGYLYTQASQENTQLLLNARVWSDLDQPVADPASGVGNLYARIVSNHTGQIQPQLRGASGSGSFSGVLASTIGGVATFSLTSGDSQGVILVEFLADRADNNVSNGISEPVRNLIAVYALNQLVPSTVPALGVMDNQEIAGTVGQPLDVVLGLSGSGIPGHTWRLSSGQLPSGLVLTSAGHITGTPTEVVAGRVIGVSVTDSTSSRVPGRANQVASGQVTINIAAAPAVPVYIKECGTGSATCSLGTVEQGQDFFKLLTGAGGNEVYTWAIDNKPGFLTFSNGLMTGTPSGVLTCPPDAPKVFQFVIDVTSDGKTKRQPVSLTVKCP